MESIRPIADFFHAIHNDGRIGPVHIGLYAALLQYWQTSGFKNPISAYSYQIMAVARISAGNTYYKLMKDLHDFGYIRYEPSFKRNQPSKVHLFI